MTQANTLLLLFDNPGKDYVARIHSAVTRQANAASLRVASDNVYESRRRAEELLDDARLAGVILTPPFSDDRHVLTLIERRGLPVVRIAPLLDPNRGSAVGMDEYDASRAITDHLVAHGHRRSGFVRGPKAHLVSMRRYNGYTNALGAKGIAIDPSLIAQGDFTRESGRAAAATLFAARPSAIFASNDEMAAGIVDAARAAGVAIPGQISLVGYDDNAVARSISPRLTTVRQPLEAMGEAAARLLADHVRNPRKPCESVTIPYEIVERESVRAALAG